MLELRIFSYAGSSRNNRLDSLINILKNPASVYCFIPGFEDTLRVNGIAEITTDQALMQHFVANGKLPISVIVIEVKEVYLHCAKALRRAGLWRLESQIDRRTLPTAGQIYRDQLSLEHDAAAIDQALEKDARERLYERRRPTATLRHPVRSKVLAPQNGSV